MEETASESSDPQEGETAKKKATERRPWFGDAAAILLGILTLPVFVVFALYCTEHILVAAKDHHWDFYRLGPLFGMFCGYELYYDLGKGPILNTLYGPMAYLSFLPLVFMPWRAYASIIIAGLALNALYFILPAVVLAWWAWRHRAVSWAYAIHFPMFFAFICLKDEPTRISMMCIHADAPALCFSGLACCCALFYGMDGRKKAPLLGAALFTCLVLWTKQTFAPIVPVLGLFFLLVHGWKAAAGYALMLVPIAAATAAGFALVLDYRALYFNAIVVPKQQPWAVAKNAIGIWMGSAEMIRDTHAHYVLPAVVFCLQFAGGKAAFRAPLDWLRRHPQGLLLLLALAEIPFATLGRVKVGGWINNFSPVIYYLALYSLISLPGTLQRDPRPEAAPVRAALPSLLGFLLAFIAAYPHSHYVRDYRERFKVFHHSEFVPYCKYLETHKGKLYYPFNPLAHLLVEGKLYHTSYALADREMAGFKISKEEFDRFTPKDMDMYVESPSHQFGITQQYLPEYTERVDIPDLLYQVCMRRPSTAPPTPPPATAPIDTSTTETPPPPMPVEAAPTPAMPAEPTPTPQAMPVEITPTQAMQVEATPTTQAMPAEATPTQAMAAEPTPTQAAPAEPVPAEAPPS